jgi:L-threonylcarbamoyladenylate synthase
METEIVRIDPGRAREPESREILRRAGEIIKSGGLVAFPTETVYGLGGNALDATASRRIYAAKGRPSDNPLIVHIAETADLERTAVEIPESAYALAARFWPGPLTMILKKHPDIPTETTGGLDTVAVRFPSHPVAQELIAAGGGFIAAPSANRSGRPSPTTAAHCIEDLTGQVNMIIDGGEVGIGVESSIVDLTEERPVILRPGYITPSMLREVLGEVETDPGLDAAADLPPEAGSGNVPAGPGPKAPGMRYRHYAPQGSMLLVTGDEAAMVERIRQETAQALAQGKRTAVIASRETADAYPGGVRVFVAGSRHDPAEVAHHLFGILRACDEEGMEMICAEGFEEGELSRAVMTRLEKACGHNIVRV